MSPATAAATRRYFARKHAPAAAAAAPSRESAYQGALALWDKANPDATYEQRDAEALRLRRRFKV